MLVVLGIITVITGIILNGQSSFNKTLVLTNTAYDIALSIRSAETYGLGGRAINDKPVGYGIHLTKGAPGAYSLFADTFPLPSISSVCHPTSDISNLDAQPGNCSYDPGSDTLVTNYTLGNNMAITDFCAFSSGSWVCANSSGATLNSLDIVFARPDPDPLMSSNGSYSSSITKSCLVVTSPQGGFRYVTVTSTGVISVRDNACL